MIEKLNGIDFGWWELQMEAMLCQKDLDMVVNKKSKKMEKVDEAIWDSKDKKARVNIMFSLTNNVSFNFNIM